MLPEERFVGEREEYGSHARQLLLPVYLGRYVSILHSLHIDIRLLTGTSGFLSSRGSLRVLQ